MTAVRVRYFGRIRELLNAKTEEYEVDDGASLADLLLRYIPRRHREASKTWPETIFRTVKGEIVRSSDGTPLLKNYVVMVYGRSVDLNHRLRDGDEVTVLPPFGGG